MFVMDQFGQLNKKSLPSVHVNEQQISPRVPYSAKRLTLDWRVYRCSKTINWVPVSLSSEALKDGLRFDI